MKLILLIYLKIPCNLNLGICSFKIKKYNLSMNYCNKVLELNYKNEKALYWKVLA